MGVTNPISHHLGLQGLLIPVCVLNVLHLEPNLDGIANGLTIKDTGVQVLVKTILT